MKTRWNWLERSVFTASCVLVTGVVVSLAVDTWTMKDSPPDLSITLGPPLRGAGGWRVPVTVLNEGDTAAEQVHVEVVSGEPGPGREHAELSLDYVPRGSRRRAWVTFHQEPAREHLWARPLGYAQP